MSSQTLLEKLQLNEEKNLLLQGLPLAIEKQFIKYSFSKNVTPLLKSKKIDFALIFAFSQKQLKEIIKEVIPALHADENQRDLEKSVVSEEQMVLVQTHQHLKQMEIELTKQLGTVIFK